MQWYYNLKIAKKLIIGFVIVALIAGAIGILGIVKIRTINNNDTILYEQNTKPLGNLAELSTQFQRMRVNVRNVILDTDKAKDYTTKIEQYYKDINQSLKEYEQGISTAEERKETDTLITLIDKQKPLSEKVVTLAMANQKEQAEKLLLNEADPAVREVEAQITKLLDYNVELGAKVSKSNDDQADSTVTMMIVIVTFAVLFSIGIGLFIARIISTPLKQMTQAADKLALGDVNVNVEANTEDEIGKLAEAFSRMIENIRNQALVVEKIADGDLTVDVEARSEKDLLGKKLAELVNKNNEILSNIASASEQVAGGSKQVSDSSMALSQGATEQASSVEELTASLEEISSQTKLNADNANQANELAENAKANAVNGNNQMKEMVQAMEEINESSAKISKVIKVIDDIAFQTNILALNAAVEAARAGQHGKGFAVVAEEVRNLAARSANAAKETTEMIEGSIKKTEGGTKIAKDTAQALDKIVTEIEKVANIVNDITVASNEQASGIAQINQGIMQVSQVIQSNSATSEESAAASEELSGQAELLKEMVDKFKLKRSTREYNKFEELSPEVIRMLKNLNEKKKTNTAPVAEAKAEAAVSKSKIALSDNDFGKY